MFSFLQDIQGGCFFNHSQALSSNSFFRHGMPRIPKCGEAIATLVKSRHRTGTITVEARDKFSEIIPTPYFLTQERLNSRKNAILPATKKDNVTV